MAEEKEQHKEEAVAPSPDHLEDPDTFKQVERRLVRKIDLRYVGWLSLFSIIWCLLMVGTQIVLSLGSPYCIWCSVLIETISAMHGLEHWKKICISVATIIILHWRSFLLVSYRGKDAIYISTAVRLMRHRKDMLFFISRPTSWWRGKTYQASQKRQIMNFFLCCRLKPSRWISATMVLWGICSIW